MNFDHEELMLMMLYNTGTRLGLVHELRLMQCYLMPDETALRELSEGVIEKLKLLTDAEFGELEFPPDLYFPPRIWVLIRLCSGSLFHGRHYREVKESERCNVDDSWSRWPNYLLFRGSNLFLSN